VHGEYLGVRGRGGFKMPKIIEQMFPKGNATKKRKQRRSDKIALKGCDPEDVLQKAANNLYNDLGIKHIRIPQKIFEFINSSGVLPTWFKIMFGIAFGGMSDNVLLLKSGRFICIELKKEGGTQQANQRNFSKEVGEDNYYLCRSIDEIINVLKSYGIIVK
jgi:hypothetical protein